MNYRKRGIEREGFRGEKKDGWRYRQRGTYLEGEERGEKGMGMMEKKRVTETEWY